MAQLFKYPNAHSLVNQALYYQIMIIKLSELCCVLSLISLLVLIWFIVPCFLGTSGW